jgi:hypothetical protein
LDISEPSRTYLIDCFRLSVIGQINFSVSQHRGELKEDMVNRDTILEALPDIAITADVEFVNPHALYLLVESVRIRLAYPGTDTSSCLSRVSRPFPFSSKRSTIIELQISATVDLVFSRDRSEPRSPFTDIARRNLPHGDDFAKPSSASPRQYLQEVTHVVATRRRRSP